MTNATETQIYTGETASFVHHGAAWLQSAAGIPAEYALAGVLFGGLVAIVAACALPLAVWDRRRPQRG